MLIVLQGNDLLAKEEKRRELYRKYIIDDFNFTEISSTVDVASVTAAMKASPMMADLYFVSIYLNKKQFIRMKDYFKPSTYTVLLLILEDFSLSEDLKQGLIIDQTISCQQLSYKDNVKWIQQKAKSLGFSIDLEDRKKLALMFQTSKELSDVIFQMSMLPEFERSEFFNDLFGTRQKFVWELFIELVEGRKKEFYTKYAVQYKQNIELTPSQFNMKLVGGLLYCLNSWKDSPSWIYEKLAELEDREETMAPFLYSHLVELLVIARKEQSNIPILMRFTKVLEEIRKV